MCICMHKSKNPTTAATGRCFTRMRVRGRLGNPPQPVLPVIWVTKLAFPPGALLAGSTQWWQGIDGQQPIAYRVIWTRPVFESCLLRWRKWQQPPQTNVQSMIALCLAKARLGQGLMRVWSAWCSVWWCSALTWLWRNGTYFLCGSEDMAHGDQLASF